jgi:hypothetical protein
MSVAATTEPVNHRNNNRVFPLHDAAGENKNCSNTDDILMQDEDAVTRRRGGEEVVTIRAPDEVDRAINVSSKGMWVSIKSKKKSLQSSPSVSQAILIIFTSGLFCCVVGVSSLMEPALISDHLAFRVFYPSGAVLMLSILLLKFPSNVIPRSVNWVKPVMQFTLLLLPAMLMISVRTILYEKPVTSILTAGAMFFGHLVLSFTYVFFCLSEIKY